MGDYLATDIFQYCDTFRSEWVWF